MTEQIEDVSVGERIRLIRRHKRLSLRALSAASGLSSNAISLIERGENSPTVSSLRRLANALEVPIAAFFQDPTEQLVTFVKAHQRSRSNVKGMLIESLDAGLVDQRLEPFLITVEAGAGATAETYTHVGEEFIHCLEGVIEYRVEDRLYEMGPGDSLLFKATQIHSFRNPSASSAVALIVIEESQSQRGDGSSPLHKGLH